jgi:CheY-like chemotaxis protein
MESRVKPRVLFVDDEPNVLSALQRLLRRLDLDFSFVDRKSVV